MSKRYSSSIIILVLLFNSIASSSSAQQARTQTLTEKSSAEIATAEERGRVSARTLAVRQVESFVDRASRFENLQFKTVLMARLADLLWADDQEYARNTFIKAMEILNAAKGTDAAQSRMIASLRRQVLSLLAQRDPALARKYAVNEAPVESKPSNANENIQAALAQVQTDPNTALEYANQSLATGVSPGMVYFLKELRSKSRPKADAFFLKVLDKLDKQSLIDGNQFLLLGTYLFTSPKLRAEGGAMANDIHAIAQVAVGDVLVYDISEDRPNISPELIRAYLSVANRLMLNALQTQDEKQKRLYHTVGYLLLPKASKSAPDLASALQTSMQQLAGNLPPGATGEDAYKNLSKEFPQTLDEQLAEIEKITGAERRDARYLLLVHRFWQQGEMENARRAASKISNLEMLSKLKILIDFAEAGKALKSDDKDSAKVEKSISRLPAGVESSLLWLAFARASSKTADKDRMLFLISQALNAAWKVTDNRRPFLLLAIAGQLAQVDASYAKQILTEAVNALNEDVSNAPPKWEQEVEAGASVMKFSLSFVVNPGQGLVEVVPDLARIDLQGTTSIIENLRREDQLGNAMLLIATTMLKGRPAKQS